MSTARSLAHSSGFSMETLGPTMRLVSDIDLHKRRRAILHLKPSLFGSSLPSPLPKIVVRLILSSFPVSLSSFRDVIIQRDFSLFFSPPPSPFRVRKTPLPRADVDFRTFTAVITDKRRYNYPDVDLAMTRTFARL